jgi:hypothetical protein
VLHGTGPGPVRVRHSCRVVAPPSRRSSRIARSAPLYWVLGIGYWVWGATTRAARRELAEDLTPFRVLRDSCAPARRPGFRQPPVPLEGLWRVSSFDDPCKQSKRRAGRHVVSRSTPNVINPSGFTLVPTTRTRAELRPANVGSHRPGLAAFTAVRIASTLGPSSARLGSLQAGQRAALRGSFDLRWKAVERGVQEWARARAAG